MARMAHLMLELGYRISLSEAPGELSFHCPLKQSDLAEALGMTPIHVNRTLRKLRALGLMSLERKIVTIHDRGRLCRLAEFSTAYLRHEDNRSIPQGLAAVRKVARPAAGSDRDVKFD
jgi:hypothetical protein